MPSSLSQSIHRALRGLWTGSLDDHRVLILLRAALFIIVVSAIALMAVDPVIRGFASIAEMQKSADPTLRERILTAWSLAPLLGRARMFLWLDALIFTPACLLLFVTFLHHFNSRLTADGTPPVFIRLKLGWRLLLVAPLLAFVAGELCNFASLYALRFANPAGTHLDPWLHYAIRGLYGATLALYGLAIGVCAWIFSTWFFKSHEDLVGGAAQVAIAARQARLRAAIADMMWRSKYAILILMFYGALVLVLDQTRDALLRQIVDATSTIAGVPGVLSTLLGVVITLVALTLLARASWLWPRLILRLRSPNPNQWDSPAAQAFAKWWCRILGLTPFLFVAVMIARAFHDVPWIGAPVRWFVLTLALILVAASVFLYRVAYRLPPGIPTAGYYDCSDDEDSARNDMGIIPFMVVWGAPTTYLLARFLGLVDWAPPLALAVITAALATWAGLLGWIAYQSRRFAIPYLLIFVALVGLFGVLDLTDVHRVRLWAENIAAFDAAGLRALFVITAILFALGLAVAWFWNRNATSGMGRLVSGVLAMLVVIAVIKFHDVAPASPADPSARPDTQAALSNWIKQLPDDAWKATVPADPTNRYPVFLIATEGGGIRSAYWTAVVLWRMKYGIEDFDRRTFALSGASGGALGLAVYRACSDDSKATRETIKACIDRFGYSDLWTQLLGGMFFEDAIATVVPTNFCRQPGCGVLGRSYWFEGALESAVPGLAKRLGAAPDPERRLPHLFLGVTRVETGERAIESDVKIDAEHFPDALDLLTLANADLRLSTAAHNSSRFPYTNPAGALYGPTCPQDPRDEGDAKVRKKPGLCTRLQDGGYFDDSGAATAIDILRALDTCLNDPTCAAPRNGVAARIKPVIIEIRNEDVFRIPPDRKWPVVCATPNQWPYSPWRADIKRPGNLFPTVISAPLTILNTRVAHMRNYEGELERDAYAAWVRLGALLPQDQPTVCDPAVSGWIGTWPVHRFDLVDDGTLYPSGWLLSTEAMKGICQQAFDKLPYGVARPEPENYCVPNVVKKR
jgi:hypothetical protein